jgi:peptidoglycan/xylan/chitin deacetylase (PgdA/CDA1 family)
MPLTRLARQLREMWEVPRDLALGRYPPFVTGGPLPRGHVPVFVFHSLDPRGFEPKLRYLADNGYLTLSGGEYWEVLQGTRPAPAKAVVLTFDDGRGSVYGVGAPLLRRYGMKGIVFLVPGRIASRAGPLPPTWDDVVAGRVAPEVVLDRERRDGAFLSWEEVESLAPSGVVEFHSHTLTHGRIHTSGDLAGFLHPEQRRGHAPLDVPLVFHDRDGRDLFAADADLGTPLLRSAPRTSEALRFFEDPAVRRACVEHVLGEGGEAFFRRRGWEASLRRLLPHPVPGRLETPAEREAAIRRELAESRSLIEAHTATPAVHLCFPWHAAGPTARRLAAETGYRSAFCGKVPGTPITLPGGDPMAIARVGEDYVERLPGRGRRALATILGRKWTRRKRSGT